MPGFEQGPIQSDSHYYTDKELFSAQPRMGDHDLEFIKNSTEQKQIETLSHNTIYIEDVGTPLEDKSISMLTKIKDSFLEVLNKIFDTLSTLNCFNPAYRGDARERVFVESAEVKNLLDEKDDIDDVFKSQAGKDILLPQTAENNQLIDPSHDEVLQKDANELVTNTNKPKNTMTTFDKMHEQYNPHKVSKVKDDEVQKQTKKSPSEVLKQFEQTTEKFLSRAGKTEVVSDFKPNLDNAKLTDTKTYLLALCTKNLTPESGYEATRNFADQIMRYENMHTNWKNFKGKHIEKVMKECFQSALNDIDTKYIDRLKEREANKVLDKFDLQNQSNYQAINKLGSDEAIRPKYVEQQLLNKNISSHYAITSLRNAILELSND